MTPVQRNVLGIIAAILAAYIALGIAVTADSAVGYPRSWSTPIGGVFVRLSAAWPHLAAAAVLGCVAGAIVNAPQRRRWLLIAGGLAATLHALSLRYLAPEWQEWAIALCELALVGAMAAGAFRLVARYGRGRDAQQRGVSAPRTAG